MRQTKRWYADTSSLAQQSMACRIRSLLTWIKYDRIKHGWVAHLRRNSATPYARPDSRPVALPALDCMDSRWRLSGRIHPPDSYPRLNPPPGSKGSADVQS